MPSLKFNQLQLMSSSEKSANQFVFKDHLNLITATENSVGKSTLVKLIFWALGCDPFLDTTWNNLDCKALLEFNIGNDSYKVLRYKNTISLKENNLPVEEYLKITGDFSKRIANLVGFRALLANRNTKEDVLETPPPAYYFTPFYIDQIQSWSKAWDNFESLQHYQNWRSTIIQYHVGLLSPEHFALEEEIFSKKNEQRIASFQLDRIHTTIDVVSSYVPNFYATVDKEILTEMVKEIEVDLNELSTKQETILDKLSKYESDKAFLEHQKIISQKIIQELDADYKFTVEYVEGDEVICPLCGVVHENSIINRASILTDKQQAENQLDELILSLKTTDQKIIDTRKELDKIRLQIDEINSKYVLENEGTTVELKSYIDAFAVSSVQRKVEKDRHDKAAEIKLIEHSMKMIKKEQKGLVDKEHTDLINQTFVNTLNSYTKLLKADSLNLSEINSPTDYNKIVKEGGAAEGTRGILAYYLAIYSTIEKFGSEVVTSMVIDTPNQHEQSITNYDKIVDLISNKMPANTQVILCAMDNQQLKPFKDRANVIYLDDNRLLDRSAEKYKKIAAEFESFYN